MSFNPPARSQPAGNASPRAGPSRPLSSSQLEADLNTSQEFVFAAAMAVRNSVKRRSMSADRRNRSLDRSRPADPLTSTPIRSRNRDVSSQDNDNRSTSVPPAKKQCSRALFLTSTPKPADRKAAEESHSIRNKIFDESMERSRPTDEEVEAASEMRALSQGPPDTPGNISLNDSQTADRSLNDTHMSWGGESGVTIASIRTARGSKGTTGTSAKAAEAARAYWTDLLKCQRDWYIKVTTTPFSSKAASSHVLDAYGELRGALCSFSPKPDEAVKAMELFAVHNTRLFVFLTERGVPDSSLALPEFVQAVLTKYLANPSHMHENDRAWLLAKHIIELIIIIPSSTDLLMAAKSTVLQQQTEFIRIWTASHAVRDLRFVSYALKCLDSMAAIIGARINQIVNGIAFGYGEEQ